MLGEHMKMKQTVLCYFEKWHDNWTILEEYEKAGVKNS